MTSTTCIIVCLDICQVHDNVQILEEGAIPLTIELPDEEKLEVQVFSCNSKTLNILVLFKCKPHTHWNSIQILVQQKFNFHYRS